MTEGKWRHWIWWGDSAEFDIILADSAPSMADDGFDKCTEAIAFVIERLEHQRAVVNDQLRRARSMLKREQKIEEIYGD